MALKLRVEALSVEYPGFKLGPVSLEVSEGLHAVLGPNGAGKTTLLRAVAGLAPRSRGEVWCCGARLTRDVWHLVSHNLVREPYGFNAKVEDYARLVVSPLAPRDWRERVRAVFRRAGVTWLLEKRWEELSAGQASLAKTLVALARPSPLLLLDEPFAHLDVLWKCRLASLLAEEASRRIILVATHDFQTLGFFDTIAILSRGTLLYTTTSLSDLIGTLSRLYGVVFLEKSGYIIPTCKSIRVFGCCLTGD